MIDEILGPLLKKRLGGSLSITIEMDGSKSQKENDENEKQGLAPVIAEKDGLVKKVPEEIMAKGQNDDEMPMPPQEMMEMEEEGTDLDIDDLVSPEEEEDYLRMEAQGRKPRGLIERAEQPKVVAKAKKDDKAKD